MRQRLKTNVSSFIDMQKSLYQFTAHKDGQWNKSSQVILSISSYLSLECKHRKIILLKSRYQLTFYFQSSENCPKLLTFSDFRNLIGLVIFRFYNYKRKTFTKSFVFNPSGARQNRLYLNYDL